MNIRGIELLRNSGFPGPRKEVISSDPSEFDLDILYDGALNGLTLLVFDYREPIDQLQDLEKNVREYKIERVDFSATVEDLVGQMESKRVPRTSMKFLAHQTYLLEDISFCGRVAMHMDSHDNQLITISAIDSLRVADEGFEAPFLYVLPVNFGRLNLSKGKIVKEEISLPQNIVLRLTKDIYKLPGNPHADFEVYVANNGLFYHDLFLQPR